VPDPELERLWKDPGNWTPLGFYRCAEDPRWWVPKRVPWMGWTINIAHRGAVLSLLGVTILMLLPGLLLMRSRQPSSSLWLPVAIIAPMFMSIGLLIWLSRRD
jgi:hypothetical protein